MYYHILVTAPIARPAPAHSSYSGGKGFRKGGAGEGAKRFFCSCSCACILLICRRAGAHKEGSRRRNPTLLTIFLSVLTMLTKLFLLTGLPVSLAKLYCNMAPADWRAQQSALQPWASLATRTQPQARGTLAQKALQQETYLPLRHTLTHGIDLRRSPP